MPPPYALYEYINVVNGPLAFHSHNIDNITHFFLRHIFGRCGPSEVDYSIKQLHIIKFIIITVVMIKR